MSKILNELLLTSTGSLGFGGGFLRENPPEELLLVDSNQRIVFFDDGEEEVDMTDVTSVTVVTEDPMRVGEAEVIPPVATVTEDPGPEDGSDEEKEVSKGVSIALRVKEALGKIKSKVTDSGVSTKGDTKTTKKSSKKTTKRRVSKASKCRKSSTTEVGTKEEAVVTDSSELAQKAVGLKSVETAVSDPDSASSAEEDSVVDCTGSSEESEETPPSKKRASVTGQSGPPISIAKDKLNDKEQKVLEMLESTPSALGLKYIAERCWPGEKKANSWVRNSLRRLVRASFAEKVGKGLYQAKK